MRNGSKVRSVAQCAGPETKEGLVLFCQPLTSISWRSHIILLAALLVLAHGAPSLAAPKVKITWWQAWTNSDDRIAIINNYIKAFEAKYPTITVEPVFVSPGQLASKARVAMAGGAPPHVLMVTPADLASLAYMGSLVPLDKFVAAEKINLRGFIPADIQKGYFDGKLYGLPHISGGANDFLIYHKELFANAGLPDQAPATWGELKQYAKKLTRMEGGKISVLGYSPRTANSNPFVAYLYSNGGSVLSPDGRQVTFNSPEGRDVFRFLTELQDVTGGGPAIKQFFDGKEGSDESKNFPFYLGQVGMMKGFQSMFKNMAVAAPGLSFGVGVMPRNESNPNASGHGTSDWGWFYVVPEGTPIEQRQAAFQWIAWLTVNKEGGATFPMLQGRPAPWMEINRRKEYFDRNPEWLNVIKVLERDIPIPITPVHNDIMSLLSTARSKVESGAMSPEAALEEAARLAQLKLDEVYKK